MFPKSLDLSLPSLYSALILVSQTTPPGTHVRAGNCRLYCFWKALNRPEVGITLCGEVKMREKKCLSPISFTDSFPCLPGFRKCKNGLCKPSYVFCDFYDDCGDLSDETNCSTYKSYQNQCYPLFRECSLDGSCLSAFNLITIHKSVEVHFPSTKGATLAQRIATFLVLLGVDNSPAIYAKLLAVELGLGLCIMSTPENTLTTD